MDTADRPPSQTWDELRREVGQIAQLYNHFRGFVATSTTAAEAALRDFAVTVARPRSAERSLQAMLDRFHSAVVPGPAGGRALLPFLHSILSQVQSEHWTVLDWLPCLTQ